MQPQAKPKEIRQARAFLQQRGIPAQQVQPRYFANYAMRMDKSFTDVLRLIASLKMAGQGQGPAPIAERVARRKDA